MACTVRPPQIGDAGCRSETFTIGGRGGRGASASEAPISGPSVPGMHPPIMERGRHARIGAQDVAPIHRGRITRLSGAHKSLKDRARLGAE